MILYCCLIGLFGSCDSVGVSLVHVNDLTVENMMADIVQVPNYWVLVYRTVVSERI